MPSYILRNIDPDLWTRAKVRSEATGQPLRAVIIALLALYADEQVSVATRATKTRRRVKP